MEDIILHIYRNGQPALSFWSQPIPLLLYEDKKHLDWFEALEDSHKIVVEKFKYIPVGEDSIKLDSGVILETTKGELHLDYYHPRKNTMKFHNSVDDLLDGL